MKAKTGSCLYKPVNIVHFIMVKLIPNKKQWDSWSLPSKLTAIGAYLGLISLLIVLVQIIGGLKNSQTSLPTAMKNRMDDSLKSAFAPNSSDRIEQFMREESVKTELILKKLELVDPGFFKNQKLSKPSLSLVDAPKFRIVDSIVHYRIRIFQKTNDTIQNLPMRLYLSYPGKKKVMTMTSIIQKILPGDNFGWTSFPAKPYEVKIVFDPDTMVLTTPVVNLDNL